MPRPLYCDVNLERLRAVSPNLAFHELTYFGKKRHRSGQFVEVVELLLCIFRLDGVERAQTVHRLVVEVTQLQHKRSAVRSMARVGQKSCHYILPIQVEP